MQTPKILILGGTNFMGKTLVNLISEKHSQYQIHLINRGRTYWNNQIFSQHPNIHHHYGDRRDSKQMTKMVEYLQNKIGINQQNPWKAVIDFSSYRWRQVQSVAKGLKKRTQVYIIISSDSIYNCKPYEGRIFTESSFNLEEEYKSLTGKKKSDKYGYDKLKCELYLYRTKILPFIALRLPDVIGPYQNTSRYWCTFEWVKRSQKYPIEICERDKTNPLCFVYSKDVAQQIIKIINDSQSMPKFKSFNLSLNQKPTYKDFVLKIAHKMEPPMAPVLKQIEDKQSNGMFPSTQYICMQNKLAKELIGWNPTTLDQCISQTNQFFGEKALNYPAQKKQMFKSFKKSIIDQE